MLAAGLALLGLQAAKNPGMIGGLATGSFKTGLSAFRGASKGLKELHKPSHTAARYAVGAAGAYGGYKVGGAIGDFAGEAHLAYEGENETSLAVASKMGSAGRMGGMLLGGGLAMGVGKMAARSGGVKAGDFIGPVRPPRPLSATAGTPGSFTAVTFKRGRAAIHRRRIKEARIEDNFRIADELNRLGPKPPVASPKADIRQWKENKRGIENQGKIAIREYKLRVKAAGDISRGAKPSFREMTPADEALYNRAQKIPSLRKKVTNRREKASKAQARLEAKESKAAANKKKGIMARSLDLNADRLSSFKRELAFMGAGLGLGGVGAFAAESINPTRRVAPEGMINGINSAPRGGISPELQMSTQGLTLGIHNRRKQRIM